MNYDSGYPEILLIFSMSVLLVGLSLDDVAWYVQYPVLSAAVVSSVISVRTVWGSSSS